MSYLLFSLQSTIMLSGQGCQYRELGEGDKRSLNMLTDWEKAVRKEEFFAPWDQDRFWYRSIYKIQSQIRTEQFSQLLQCLPWAKMTGYQQYKIVTGKTHKHSHQLSFSLYLTGYFDPVCNWATMLSNVVCLQLCLYKAGVFLLLTYLFRC